MEKRNMTILLAVALVALLAVVATPAIASFQSDDGNTEYSITSWTQLETDAKKANNGDVYKITADLGDCPAGSFIVQFGDGKSKMTVTLDLNGYSLKSANCVIIGYNVTPSYESNLKITGSGSETFKNFRITTPFIIDCDLSMVDVQIVDTFTVMNNRAVSANGNYDLITSWVINSGASFTLQSGKLSYKNSGPYEKGAISNSGTITIDNGAEFNLSSGKTITLGGAYNINGTFTINSGIGSVSFYNKPAAWGTLNMDCDASSTVPVSFIYVNIDIKNGHKFTIPSKTDTKIENCKIVNAIFVKSAGEIKISNCEFSLHCQTSFNGTNISANGTSETSKIEMKNIYLYDNSTIQNVALKTDNSFVYSTNSVIQFNNVTMIDVAMNGFQFNDCVTTCSIYLDNSGTRFACTNTTGGTVTVMKEVTLANCAFSKTAFVKGDDSDWVCKVDNGRTVSFDKDSSFGDKAIVFAYNNDKVTVDKVVPGENGLVLKVTDKVLSVGGDISGGTLIFDGAQLDTSNISSGAIIDCKRMGVIGDINAMVGSKFKFAQDSTVDVSTGHYIKVLSDSNVEIAKITAALVSFSADSVFDFTTSPLSFILNLKEAASGIEIELSASSVNGIAVKVDGDIKSGNTLKIITVGDDKIDVGTGLTFNSGSIFVTNPRDATSEKIPSIKYESGKDSKIYMFSGSKLVLGTEEIQVSADSRLMEYNPSVQVTVTGVAGEGGTVTGTATTLWQYDSYSAVIDAYTVTPDEGYTFVNWEDDTGSVVTRETLVRSGSDHTITAVFSGGEAKVTVTFKPNNGESAFTEKIEAGSKLAEPKVTYAGHIFVGWFNGNSLWTFATDTFDKDTTLEARWEVVKENIVVQTDGSGKAEIAIPQDSDVIKSIEVRNEDKSITLNEDSVQKVREKQKNLYVTVTEVNDTEDVFEVIATYGDEPFYGTLVIELPYDKTAGTPSLYWRNGDTDVPMEFTIDENRGVVVFTTDHNSYYVLKYADQPASANGFDWALLIVFTIAVLGTLYVAVTTKYD